MNVIRSRLHEIFSEEVNKIALASEDDKRVIMEDGVHTKAIICYMKIIKNSHTKNEQKDFS